ncbi:hypothetical protein J4E81_005495 [Alternaria sp. BMP 2799]|nr:hypothetical protein J4E81_005495 [Alternaria sp. BMP 2799]
MANIEDHFEEVPQYEADQTGNTRKRALEFGEDNNRDNSERCTAKQGSKGVTQNMRTKKRRTTGEPPPDMYQSRRKLSSSLEKGIKDVGSVNIPMANNDTETHDNSTRGSPLEGPESAIMESMVDIEQLCANEDAEMFILKRAKTEQVDNSPPVMLMKVPYKLATMIQNQISTGLKYRREKDISIPKLDQELRMSRLSQKSVEHRLQGLPKLSGGRTPTPRESPAAERLHREAHEINRKMEKIEQKKKTLSRDIGLARKEWEGVAVVVEKNLQDIFVRCGLFEDDKAVSVPPVAQGVEGMRMASKPPIVSRFDEKKDSKLLPGENEATTIAANVEELSVGQAIAIVREAKARREKHEVQRQHDEHRNTFRRGLLAARVAAAADRPDAPDRLIEEEFSRDYVRAGSKLAEAVTRAEAAHEAQLVAAAEAGVSIIGSDDDREPNFPYDLEEYAAVKKQCLDRDAVQEWINVIDASSKPNLRPLGYLLHMAEKWKRAAEEDDDASSSGEDFMPNTGVEPRREASPTQGSVMKLASKSKSWHTEPYWSFSDCAEGKKRRRIDDWTRKIQQPVG